MELNDPIQKDYVTRRDEIKPKERPPNNRTGIFGLLVTIILLIQKGWNLYHLMVMT